jgi:3-hydroxyisobutyrate dehydrogenase-like beta-hydroxyacid dehydrogenase
MAEKRCVGMIGLGLLGSALAERLGGVSFSVVGYDIDASRREAARAAGCRVAEDHHEVAAHCDRILLSLPTTSEVEAVVVGWRAELRPGHLLIDTTTGDPERVAALGSELDQRSVGYLDATISGSSAQARKGDVIVMAGGRPDHFEACEDVFRALARRWFHVGRWGDGTRLKLVSNLILGLNRAVLAEGLALARTMGLDAGRSLAILAESAAYSRVMDTKGPKMVHGEFSPQARLSQHLKDVRLILAEGARLGLELPLSAVHRALLERLEQAGYGDADNSAIVRAFEPAERGTAPPSDDRE